MSRNLQWQSRFVFGPADALETLELELPIGLWQHSTPTVGISRKTATGVPGVTFQSRQQILIVPVRYTENEAPAVRRLIEWGQTKAPFLWTPDVADFSQLLETLVILASPRVGETVVPDQDGEYPRVSVVRLGLRQWDPLDLSEDS